MLICGRLWHFRREYKLKSKREAAKGLRADRPMTSEDVGIVRRRFGCFTSRRDQHLPTSCKRADASERLVSVA